MPCNCGKIISSKKNTVISSTKALTQIKSRAVPSCDDECPPLTCLDCPTTCQEYNISVDISFNYIPLGAIVPLGGKVPTNSLSLELLTPNVLRFYYHQEDYPPFYISQFGVFMGYQFEFQQGPNTPFENCGECLRKNVNDGDLQFFSLEKTMDLLIPNIFDTRDDLDYKDNLRNDLIYFFLNIEKNYFKYYQGKKSCDNTNVPWTGYSRLIKKTETGTETFSTNSINLYTLTVGQLLSVTVETGKNFQLNDNVYFFANIDIFFSGNVLSYNPTNGNMNLEVLEIKGVNNQFPNQNTYDFWLVNTTGNYEGSYQVFLSSSIYLNQSIQTAFYKDIFLSSMNAPINVKSIFRNMCIKRYKCLREYVFSGQGFYPTPFQNTLINPFIEPTSDKTNSFFRIMNMVAGLMNFLFTLSENYLLGKETGIPNELLSQYLDKNRARYYYNSYFQTLISRNKILGFDDALNISNGSGTYIRVPGLPNNNYFLPNGLVP